MPRAPIVLLLAVAALAAAQLALQTGRLVQTMLLLGPILPALAIARPRSAPAAVVTVPVRSPSRRDHRVTGRPHPGGV